LRFDNEIKETSSNKAKVTRWKIYSRFSIARIQMGQKIHGALLTASTQFMRKRVMDVYMEN
jgi:hypothetical protein